MNLRSKIAHGVAVTALALGMTSGLAADLPQQADDDAELNVTCTDVATIAVDINSAFEIDLLVPPGPSGYSDSISDAVTITVDLTCNDVEGWVVGTGISDFAHDGVVDPGKAQTFSGNKFTLSDGSLVSYTPGPTHGPGDAAPIVLPAVAPNFFFDIAMTTDLILFDWAAPGVSVANWDANLNNVPANVAEGTYKADFTVVLYVP